MFTQYNINLNEGLNMAITRYFLKFKHYGSTMPLDTRIRYIN